VQSRRDVIRGLLLLGAGLAVPTALTGCGSTPADPAQPQGSDPAPSGRLTGVALASVDRGPGDPSAIPAAAQAVQAFTTAMLPRLAAEPGNLAFSPHSILTALAMTRAGAGGRTAEEMDAVLHTDDPDRLAAGLNALEHSLESAVGTVTRADGSEATLTLDIANSLWGQGGVSWEQAFLEILAVEYGAGMNLVDFMRDPEAGRAAVNAWTSEATHERIPEILAPGLVDAMTRLVLVNAIYLKAPWESPFEPALTTSAPFTRIDGSQVQASMMANGEVRTAGYARGPGWQAARLPYAGGTLAMTVVLPDGSLQDLVAGLGPEQLHTVLTSPQPAILDVRLPRWRVRTTAALADHLVALGMPTAFEPGRADFSGMTHDQELFISAVAHEAFVAVDEEGTEAAAATAVVMRESSAVRAQQFHADRAFLFVIHDVESATPLFVGLVDDPTAVDQ
jgi:serpin B